MSASRELLMSLASVLEYRRNPVYNAERAKKLKKRLENFSEEDLELAARTLADNAFMMGDNPGGVKYATVDYLIRSDENVEKWLEIADMTSEDDLTKVEF